LPYAELLGKVGLALQRREFSQATLGFSLQREPNAPLMVASVEPGSGAEKSGLQVGDEIVRWNAGEAPRRPERWVAQQKPGGTLHLLVRRAEKELPLDVTLGEMHETFYQVTEISNAGERERRIREGMLRGTTDPVSARAR
jgi:predicted metalloprotease with PDZ domain